MSLVSTVVFSGVGVTFFAVALRVLLLRGVVGVDLRAVAVGIDFKISVYKVLRSDWSRGASPDANPFTESNYRY